MADTAIQVAGSTTALARPETFAPRTLQEALKFADLLIDSGMLPKSYTGKNAATIVVALQFGMELGLQPMQSLQNIASINGQPGIWGDAALALVLGSGLCEYYEEDDFETIKKNLKASFTVKRRGFPKPKTTTFSYEDAKTAGIFTNAVWKTYPFRMCQMRARSFGLRDSFPDVLKGLELAEALQDYPGETIDGAISQPAQPETKQEPKEELVGPSKATEFYKEYWAHGWSSPESKEWLKANLGIEDSRNIPVSKWPQALAWAQTNAPIRTEAEAVEEFLGLTQAEREALWLKHSVKETRRNPDAWPNLLAEVKSEIAKRDAQERGE